MSSTSEDWSLTKSEANWNVILTSGKNCFPEARTEQVTEFEFFQDLDYPWSAAANLTPLTCSVLDVTQPTTIENVQLKAELSNTLTLIKQPNKSITGIDNTLTIRFSSIKCSYYRFKQRGCSWERVGSALYWLYKVIAVHSKETSRRNPTPQFERPVSLWFAVSDACPSL